MVSGSVGVAEDMDVSVMVHHEGSSRLGTKHVLRGR